MSTLTCCGGYADDAASWTRNNATDPEYNYSFEIYPIKGEQFLSVETLRTMPANVVEVILHAEHLNQESFAAMPVSVNRIYISVDHKSRPLNFNAKCFQKFTNLQYLEIHCDANLIQVDYKNRVHYLNAYSSNILFKNEEDFDYLPASLNELHLYCQTAISPSVFGRLPRALKVGGMEYPKSECFGCLAFAPTHANHLVPFL
jgi:hypothetical protein